MFHYNREDYRELTTEHPNWIEEQKTHVLPHVITTRAVVELYMPNGYTTVESQHAPIRYGRHAGTRVHLGSNYGKIDLNPKFIWNGKEWLLNTHGTAIFAELEINPEPREPLKCTQ